MTPGGRAEGTETYSKRSLSSNKHQTIAPPPVTTNTLKLKKTHANRLASTSKLNKKHLHQCETICAKF